MRLGGLLALALLAGCMSEDGLPSAPWQASYRMDDEADRVLLDVSLIQAPLADPFLDHQVWSSADEMLFPLDKRELLDANGFRMGLLVGSPPEGITSLLQSERTCVGRRGRSTSAGMTVTQLVREGDEPLELSVQLVGRRETLKLDRPRFSLDLTPRKLSEGKIRLRLVPRVESGDKVISYRPVPEESKWTLESKRPGESLDDLACDVELLPNQILIIGCRLEREGSAGYHGFVRTEGTEPMQRLMVLRHLRPTAASGTAGERE